MIDPIPNHDQVNWHLFQNGTYTTLIHCYLYLNGNNIIHGYIRSQSISNGATFRAIPNPQQDHPIPTTHRLGCTFQNLGSHLQMSAYSLRTMWGETHPGAC